MVLEQLTIKTRKNSTHTDALKWFPCCLLIALGLHSISKILIYLFLLMCVSAWVYEQLYVGASAHGGHKTVLEPLGLELLSFMRYRCGFELQYSWLSSFLQFWTISLIPIPFYLKFKSLISLWVDFYLEWEFCEHIVVHNSTTGCSSIHYVFGNYVGNHLIAAAWHYYWAHYSVSFVCVSFSVFN